MNVLHIEKAIRLSCCAMRVYDIRWMLHFAILDIYFVDEAHKTVSYLIRLNYLIGFN